MPGHTGAFSLLPSVDGAVVALRHGIHQFVFESRALTLLLRAPFDSTRCRFNGGAHYAKGRLGVGAMFDLAYLTLPAEKTSRHQYTFAR